MLWIGWHRDRVRRDNQYKTDTESLVGIDGKVGFETLFTVTAIESFIIAQVGKGRKRIGKYDIFRAEYGKVVWIGKKN